MLPLTFLREYPGEPRRTHCRRSPEKSEAILADCNAILPGACQIYPYLSGSMLADKHPLIPGFAIGDNYRAAGKLDFRMPRRTQPIVFGWSK